MAAAEEAARPLDPSEESLVHGGACNTCRRKKQKCSREDPCRSCINSGSVCIYEEGQRRGAKPGYIESLAKRMDTLEALVLGQSLLLSPSLASPTNGVANTDNGSLEDKLQAVRQSLLRSSNKRQRQQSVSDTSASSAGSIPMHSTDNNVATTTPLKDTTRDPPRSVLPPMPMLRELITIYFSHIHPWIPILHGPMFETALQSSDNQPSEIILQAITAATIKFYPLDHSTQEWYHSRCHDAVVLACMDRFSVETLQASIILAFNTTGSGKGPRSWSIVASATRIVEQLGLAVEEEDAVQNKLLNRIGFLPPAKNWTEAEGLRRIFWCIFLLDRFCSVSTGWNTSLTSTDIKRRLPVEGCFWRDQVDTKARYFNIAGDGIDQEDETGALGGLAYLVEASECLNRVATFLLRDSVDLSASDGLRRWFERFQSLDAMLVRWKTFLPARWQVAGIDATGRMDENLTLAHITHNTSVIMLHQNIAYPDASFRHRLPSQNAAKTCVAAAGEIATIAAKFIANSPVVIPPAFSFCLFIAARVLLADSNHFSTPVDPNFDILLHALRDASTRWRAGGLAFASENLAGQFADRIDAAWRSRSPINVRSVALQEDGGALSMSLASPPMPDIFRSASANGSAMYDIGVDDTYSVPNIGLQDFNRIFTWTDEMIGG
ncbi:fungal-specific transcription factor domain-containing protein [Mariannaea sp. PMI_226]|nr:fungal-specific transcription factor domain-containing protein [Mariannaea sp. PMI_226]